MTAFNGLPSPLRVGVSAVFDPAVTAHARTFLRAMAVGRNLLPGLNGVRWHWLDDGADPQRGAEVAQQMIDWGADLVIGHFSSDAALAAAPLYREAGIALLTPAATVDALTQHGNVLRFCPADQHLAGDLLAWVQTRGWQRLHIAADDSAHGQALAVAIARQVARQGLQQVATAEQAELEIFAGRLKPSREHWQARRAAGSQTPLVLTDDAASTHLGKACAQDSDTYVIGFDDSADDYQHQPLFGCAPQTYYRESLRLLHVVAALAGREWPNRRALLEALHRERFATPLGDVAFVHGECQGVRNCIWRVGPGGLEPLHATPVYPHH
ncbi:ABC transporter substrate-binding protein [Pseudomonas sp. 3A(2025)]